MSRLEGIRWRLRRAREMRPAMEFEWVFFRLLFGAKRECRHLQGYGEETQIPLHTSRIISRAASAAPAASLCAGHAQQLGGESPLADLMEVRPSDDARATAARRGLKEAWNKRVSR
jgi:hypothetical protein